jgi:hypothetical protein
VAEQNNLYIHSENDLVKLLVVLNVQPATKTLNDYL